MAPLQREARCEVESGWLFSFDLDGVLVRNPFRDGVFPQVCGQLAPSFGGDARQALQALLEEHRRRIRQRDLGDGAFDPAAPYDWDDVVRQVAAGVGLSLPDEPLAAKVARFCQTPGYIAYMHPTVVGVLRWLREQGFGLVAVTNGLWRYQQPVLQALGLEGLFSCVSAPDRTRSAKPFADAFWAAWGEVPADRVVHVGDDLLYDVAAARRLGARAIWVMTPELAADPEVRHAPPWRRPAVLVRKDGWRRELERLLARRAQQDRALAELAVPDAAVLHVGEIPLWVAQVLKAPPRLPGRAFDPEGATAASPVLDLRPVGEALVKWFVRHQRDLPWRRHRDPYGVLVAEFMLQQTRVQTVLPYYRRFMERFPTVQELARADEQQVLELWQGLGYYQRARHLLQAARMVVREFGGAVPRQVDQLRRLPGVGPYMAAAVASIAFGEPEPAIDGNALRVLSRLVALWEPAGSARALRLAREFARAMLPEGKAGEFTQGLMELGATVCLPRPRCGQCPLQRWCAAWARGLQEQLPVRRARRAVPQVAVAAVRIRDGQGRVLLVRRPDGGLLGGTWALPAVEKREGESWEEAAARAARLGGFRAVSLVESGELEHTFSHRRWKVRVFDGMAAHVAEDSPPYGAGDGPWERMWADEGQASRRVASRAFQRALALPWKGDPPTALAKLA